MAILALALSCFSISSCGSDDDDDNGNPKESTITDNDPEGTILLNLVNNDDDIMIEDNYPYMYVGMTPQNNIDTWYYDAEIVSIGKVKGLSAIKKIPESGWAERCAAIQGNGYIIRQKKINNGMISGYKYCRIYLVDFITSTSGGIMGATIKYQLWNPDE